MVRVSISSKDQSRDGDSEAMGDNFQNKQRSIFKCEGCSVAGIKRST
jgi:hypothetical protein